MESSANAETNVTETPAETVIQEQKAPETTVTETAKPKTEPVKQEPVKEEPKQERVEIHNGFTQDELAQINEAFNTQFQTNPLNAVQVAVEEGFNLALSPEQQEYFNQVYLEWEDKNPLEAKSWFHKIGMLQYEHQNKYAEKERLSKLEKDEKALLSRTEALKSIIEEREYFKEPEEQQFLHLLAEYLEDIEGENPTSERGEYFRQAASQIHTAIERAEKRGYDRAIKEHTKKKNAYVAGSGNTIPQRGPTDEKAEAVANKDVDKLLGMALRGLKKDH